MIGILKIAFAIVVGLAVAGMAVSGMSDRYLLAAPPERELDGILVMIANKRYAQARALLPEGLKGTSVDSLRAIHDGFVRRIGTIEEVDTKREWMTRDRASAIARMTSSDQREVRFRVPLTFDRGRWRVADLRPISDAAR